MPRMDLVTWQDIPRNGYGTVLLMPAPRMNPGYFRCEGTMKILTIGKGNIMITRPLRNLLNPLPKQASQYIISIVTRDLDLKLRRTIWIWQQRLLPLPINTG